MNIDQKTLADAADTLRSWALDEDLKAAVLAEPTATALASRIARRYIAGADPEDALALLPMVARRGHLSSIECVGESVRDSAIADRETNQIIGLAEQLVGSGHQATLSFDLSHIGSLISPALGLRNAHRIARAARDAETSVMISAEGSARTDLVLDLYEQLADDFPETGITLQARLHRTPQDLQRVMKRPGPVRVVKGAFLEPEDVALPRDAPAMGHAYSSMVATLVESEHRVNIATHDSELVYSLRRKLGDALHGDHVEFETLQGLGTESLDTLRGDGFRTREYLVYGPEWWLYVLNRIAEHPERILFALADITPAAARQ